MKMPSVSLKLRKAKPSDREGYINISVSVPGTGKTKFRSTGHKIDERFWDAKKEVVKPGMDGFSSINEELSEQVAKLQQAFLDDYRQKVDFTEYHILSRLNNKAVENNDFYAFYKEHIDYLDNSKKASSGYIRHLTSEYNSLKKFAPVLSFSDITLKFLQKYEVELAKTVNPGTTLNTKLRRLRMIIDLAVERGLIKKEQIATHNVPVYKAPERGYLLLEETDTLANLVYDGKLSHDENAEKVCAFFIIECYSGIRFSDWGRFRTETLISGKNLKVRAKKNGEPVYLPLDKFPRLNRMIEHIVSKGWKFNITEQMTNYYLKTLATIAGIDMHLTTHKGRHTCGTLLAELGYDYVAISDVLGISEKTAKIYTKLTRQRLRNVIERHGGL